MTGAATKEYVPLPTMVVRWSAKHTPSGTNAIFLFVAGLIAFMSLYPIGWLVFGSFYSAQPLQDGQLTLDNYRNAYSSPILFETIKTTLLFAAGQTVVSVAVGTGLGWVVARTNTPGRRAFELMALVIFLVPTLLAVVAWSMLLSPRSGLINQVLVAVFGFETPPFDIFTLWGMIFVQGLYLAPLTYLIITPSFTSMDASLEEAAKMSGANLLQVLRRITGPLLWPSVLSASLLMFVIGLESFDVPQLLGGPQRIFTFTSLIFSSISVFYPPDFGAATAIATGLLVAASISVFFYYRATRQAARYETIKGKGYKVATIDLGPWKWVTFGICAAFFLLTVFLPLLVLAIGSLLPFFGRFDMAMFDRMSFDNYVRVFRHPQLVAGFFNSLALSIFGGAACVLISAVVAFITLKTKFRGRRLLDGVAMLPIAFPSTVLGLALLWAWITVPAPVYGTVMVLAVAYITRYIPIGLRTMTGGFMQISSELEEAARMSGATWPRTFWHVILPLLRPTLAAAWLLMFMIFMRELSMSIMLAGPGNPVVSVVLFDYFTSGELGPLSAASLLMATATLLIVFLSRKLLNISYTDIRTG